MATRLFRGRLRVDVEEIGRTFRSALDVEQVRVIQILLRVNSAMFTD